MGRYEDYMNDPNSLVAAYGGAGQDDTGALQPGNAPAATQPASQGALQGEAPSGAEPAFGAGPAVDASGQQMGPTKEKAAAQQKGKDFFSYFQSADDDERDMLTKNVLEPIEASGMSGEGAVAKAFSQNPQAAMEVGAKFGWVPPTDKGGMPGFKTEQRALADYEQAEQDSRDNAEKLKKEKRQAIGGFLFEMGLRILASNRPDAGGAIAEGALGTIEARKARQVEGEERAYTKEQREEAGTDRERKRGFEDEEESRAKAEAGRREDIHEAKKRVGDRALAGMGDRNSSTSVAEWEFDLFKSANRSEKWTAEEMAQKFIEHRENSRDIKKGEKERLLQNYIKQIDGSMDQPEGWDEMSVAQKRKQLLSELGWEDGGDKEEDVLGIL